MGRVLIIPVGQLAEAMKVHSASPTPGTAVQQDHKITYKWVTPQFLMTHLFKWKKIFPPYFSLNLPK